MFYVNTRAIIERNINGILQIVVQTRNKMGEPKTLELPGGQLELFEPILNGLKREVMEETGLSVVKINGEETRIDTCGINPDFEVECIEPFCVYQTIKGPIDSVGMYFLCETEGEILINGDDTENVHWRSVIELKELMETDPKQFSDVDRAGIMYYIKVKTLKSFK